MNLLFFKVALYDVFLKQYKFNRPHGPCDMANYTTKH